MADHRVSGPNQQSEKAWPRQINDDLYKRTKLAVKKKKNLIAWGRLPVFLLISLWFHFMRQDMDGTYLSGGRQYKNTFEIGSSLLKKDPVSWPFLDLVHGGNIAGLDEVLKFADFFLKFINWNLQILDHDHYLKQGRKN